MNIKNISVGVINIDGKAIIPQQSVTIPDSYKKNPVVMSLIKNGLLSEKAVKTEEEVVKDTPDDFAAFMGTNPTLTKLKAYAKKNGIDLGDAKTEEEIVAVIKACLAIVE